MKRLIAAGLITAALVVPPAASALAAGRKSSGTWRTGCGDWLSHGRSGHGREVTHCGL